MLISQSTDSLAVGNGHFGSFTGSILLDNLVCEGAESSLLNCASNVAIGNSNCQHSEDAGVRCEMQCNESSIRLLYKDEPPEYLYTNEGNLPDYYFIKDELSRGRVEVCMSASWGAVCSHLWSNTDTSVVCSQLLFSPYGKYIYVFSMFNIGV